MNDVFISYSRRNKDFTQKLYNALTGANRTVWADWDSIPAASDWFAEIKQGIEETNSVLFVLSPEWIKSNECRKELNYAVEMGKRLFPILFEPVDPNDVPPELAKINWVYMRDTDDFDKAFQTLCNAMDTNLEWIKAHTRLQIRALEWDHKNRDHSFVLRGNDLTNGEQFLAASSGKSPDATALQGEYIVASRKDATRRQRLTLVGVTIALIVSIALGVVALFARQAAVIAQNEAEQERNRALDAEKVAESERDRAVAAEEETQKALALSESARLAAQAQNVLSDPLGNPETAMLLSLKSLQVQYHSQADQALTDSIQKFNLLNTYQFGSQFGNNLWTDIAISPDGKVLAIASNDGKAKIDLFDTETNEVSQTLNFTTFVYGVKFSPDGKYLAIARGDNKAELLDLANGKIIMEFNNHTDGLTSLDISPDGKYLLTGSYDQTAILWDIATGEPLRKFFSHTEGVHNVTFSPDGRFIFTAGADQIAYKWSVGGGQLGGVATVNDIEDVSVSPDGRLFATATDGKAEIWDASSLKLIKTFSQSSYINVSIFSADGRYLVTGASDGTVRIWDIEQEQIVNSYIGHVDEVTSITYSPDGKYIYTGSLDGTMRKWNAEIESSPWILQGHDSRVTDVAFSPDGKTIVTGSWDENPENIYKVWDASTGAQISSLIGHTWASSSVSFSQDGKHILTSNGDGTVKIWDAATYEVIQTIQSQDGKWTNSAVFSPNGRYILIGNDDGTATYWNWERNEKILTLTTSYSARSVAISPDGNWAAVGAYTGEVSIFDLKTGKVVQTYAGYGILENNYMNVETLQFSPDGKLVLFSSIKGNVSLLNKDTGTIMKVLSHTQEVHATAMSPDGKYIATGGSDRIVRVWDAQTGELVYTLTGHTDAIFGIAFSPDSKHLATASADKTIRIWFTDFKEKRDYACSLISRQLTADEIETFFVTDKSPVCK